MRPMCRGPNSKDTKSMRKPRAGTIGVAHPQGRPAHWVPINRGEPQAEAADGAAPSVGAKAEATDWAAPAGTCLQEASN